MQHIPTLVAMDLEGVFVPEMWVAIADRLKIDELRLTTREVSDYDQLMRMRLRVLRERSLSLADVQGYVQESVHPLPGAVEFLNRLRSQTAVIILSDIFYEFVAPLLPKLNFPTIFCNTLTVDDEGMITDYHIRQQDGKRHAIQAFNSLGFRTFAAGDSYNDLTMIKNAHYGSLFCPPQRIVDEHPELAVANSYDELQAAIEANLFTPAQQSRIVE